MYCCMAVYNGALTLHLSLFSIVPFVEKIIMVDGAYALFPHTHPQSTDGTKEIAERICGNKLIWVDCPKKNGKYIPWIGQVSKRTASIAPVPNGKHLIIHDSDEIIVGEIQREFEIVERHKDWHCVAVPEINFAPLGEGCSASAHSNKLPIVPHRALHDIPRMVWQKPYLKWVGYFAPTGRYAIYLKEEGMHYSTHHSRVCGASGERMTTIYGKAKYTLREVMFANLKFLYSYDRFHAGMVYRLSRPRDEK